MQKIRLLLLLSLIGFLASSCARKIVLHPLDGHDIRQDGEWVCMTPAYVDQVMKAKLEQKGL